MIPTPRLAWLAAPLIAVAVACLWTDAALVPLVLGDVALVAVAALDLFRCGGPVRLWRDVGPVQGAGVRFTVQLFAQHDEGSAVHLRLGDDAPGAVEGLPVVCVVEPGAPHRVSYRCTLPERGLHHFGALVQRRRSPWGLWERQVRQDASTAVRVYPDFRHLRGDTVRARDADRRLPVRARRKPGGDSEFDRLRSWVDGDPLRHMDWKATARRQQPIVRQYGEEVNQNVVFLLDAGRMMTARLGGRTAFDIALDASLSMAHTALRRGDRVGLLAYDGEVRTWVPPRGSTRQSHALLRATFDVFPRLIEADHRAALHHLATRVRRRSLVVLLTTVTDSVNADGYAALVAALRGRHLPLVIWLRDPELDARLQDPAVDDLALLRRGAAAELVGWRERALGDLRKRGALVLDCAPEALSTQLIQRYLDIKARHLL